ncbi:hypothetical protein WJX74_000643 [Apatococcus lobatus]|uniref:Uncharacterized protein n=1 Tax=Apatococcus lobatus TaxID=904363 RepID=A0AAW1QM44_9CHLO
MCMSGRRKSLLSRALVHEQLPSPTGPEARPFSSLRDRQIASRNRPLQAPPGKSTARSWCLGRLPSCLGSRC